MNKETGFVSDIIVAITGHKDCFNIKSSIDERGVLISLDVDSEHLGRVIGRNGETARSLRGILRALGTEHKARYSLVIGKRN